MRDNPAIVIPPHSIIRGYTLTCVKEVEEEKNGRLKLEER